MNNNLTKEIVQHIFANFGIIDNGFVDKSKTKSLLSKEFLLPITLDLIDGDKEIKNNVYGFAATKIHSSNDLNLEFLLADCTIDPNIPEHCLIVRNQVVNSAYGLYSANDTDHYSLIASSIKDGWIVAGTSMQAALLAAMEEFREIGFQWSKLDNYTPIFNMLLSYIAYHEDFYGEELDEG